MATETLMDLIDAPLTEADMARIHTAALLEGALREYARVFSLSPAEMRSEATDVAADLAAYGCAYEDVVEFCASR